MNHHLGTVDLKLKCRKQWNGLKTKERPTDWLTENTKIHRAM